MKRGLRPPPSSIMVSMAGAPRPRRQGTPRLGKLARYLGLTPDQLGGTAGNILNSMLIQPADDALWSLMNPLDALTGQGRAANQSMAYPIFGRFGAKTPGLRAETLQRGDERMTFDGWKELYQPQRNERAYVLRNENDEIVASANRELHRPIFSGQEQRTAYVPEMWVRPDYRKSTAMFDLYRLLTHGGKLPVSASFANQDLKHVFERKLAREQGLPDPGSRVRARKSEKRAQRAFEDSELAGPELTDFEIDMHVANTRAQRMAEAPTLRNSSGIAMLRANAARQRAARETATARARVNPVQSLNMDAARQLQLALAMERSGRIARQRRRPAPVADAFLPPALRVGRPAGTRGGR